MYHISVHISTAQTKKTPSQERPRDGISLISRLIATTFRYPSLDMFPQTNRVEAAVPPSTPDRPVSAARRKIHYTGRVIKKKSTEEYPAFLCAFPVSPFPVSLFLLFPYFYFSLFFTVSFSLFPYISLISMRLICGMRISGIVKGWSGFAAAAGSCPSPGEPLLSSSPLPGL